MFGKVLCWLGLHEEVKGFKSRFWQEYVCIRPRCETRRRVLVVS